MHESYLASFHGLDVGLIYNIPKNVRIYMYCVPGKPISAEIVNEARTWDIATLPDYDRQGKFMTNLLLRQDGPSVEWPYCVFSGNLVEEDMNRVPDLYFEDDEEGDFRTGLFHLPASFRRVFLRDHFSGVDQKLYQAGDIEELNSEILHNCLLKQSRSEKVSGFLHYFLEPSTLKKKRYEKLPFVVVPNSQCYESYNTLLNTQKPSKVAPNRIRYEIDDKSIPNTNSKKEVKRVLKIRKQMEGLYLSDIVRILCERHYNEFITIIVSACRCFHDDLSTSVKDNQRKTARVDAKTYYDKLAINDVTTI